MEIIAGHPPVSVIVPIYNVEPYLRECVDSILLQHYRNIEIILVDDGSTDGCPALCDQFAADNPSVVAIHQNNRGLSGARNSGLEVCHGEYVTFVDSDDWLAPDMVSRCMELILENDADVCGVSFNLAYPDGRFVPNETVASSPEVYDTKEALSKYLFNTNLGVCVCGKVWSRELWREIRCPEGLLHEDQHTTYRLLGEADKVVFVPEPLYFYRQREGSIGHSSFSERSYDLLEGVDAQYSYVVGRYPDVEALIGAACSFWYCVFVNMMLRDNYWDAEAGAKCRDFVRRHLNALLGCAYFPLKRKIQLTLFAVSFSLYKLLYRVFIAKRTLVGAL